MRLWRADATDVPWFGFKSYWTTSRQHAELYAFFHEFGGPTLYAIDVTLAASDLLDLRGPDGWGVLSGACGVDEGDYDEGILGHDLLQDVAGVIAAAGFLWVAHVAYGTDRREARPPDPDEWMYVGDSPLIATSIGPIA